MAALGPLAREKLHDAGVRVIPNASGGELLCWGIAAMQAIDPDMHEATAKEAVDTFLAGRQTGGEAPNSALMKEFLQHLADQRGRPILLHMLQPSAGDEVGIAETFKVEAWPEHWAGGLAAPQLNGYVLQTVVDEKTGYSHFEGLQLPHITNNPFAMLDKPAWLVRTPSPWPSPTGTPFFTPGTGSPPDTPDLRGKNGGGGAPGVNPEALANALRKLANGGDQRNR